MANNLLSRLRRRDRLRELANEPLNPPGVVPFGVVCLTGFFFGTGILFIAEETQLWQPPMWAFGTAFGAMLVGWFGACVCHIRGEAKEQAGLQELRTMIQESGGTVPKLPGE